MPFSTLTYLQWLALHKLFIVIAISLGLIYFYHGAEILPFVSSKADQTIILLMGNLSLKLQSLSSHNTWIVTMLGSSSIDGNTV